MCVLKKPFFCSILGTNGKSFTVFNASLVSDKEHSRSIFQGIFQAQIWKVKACVDLPWKYCNRAPFFSAVTICGANHSLLWCFFTAPGSQRSPVNQCGCHSDVSLLGFFTVDEVSLSSQLVLFSCYSSSSVYSEQIGNINLFPACAPQNYSQMYET